MRCPSCQTDVPAARFCNRCGALLQPRGPQADPGIPLSRQPSATDTAVGVPPDHGASPTTMPPAGDPPPSSSRRLAALVLALGVAVGLVTAGGLQPPPGRSGSTGLATTAAAPAATSVVAMAPLSPRTRIVTICSNMQQRTVTAPAPSAPEVGSLVDVFGTPCLVSEVVKSGTDTDVR